MNLALINKKANTRPNYLDERKCLQIICSSFWAT